MRLKKKFVLSNLFLVFIIYNLSIVSVFGLTGDAGSPGAFLNWGAGARSLGMGRAMTGLANDPSAIYFNPAGLTQLNPLMLTFMHSQLSYGTTYEYLGFALPTRGTGNFGTAFIFLNTSAIEDRSIQNTRLGTFEDQQFAWLASYARDIKPYLSLGGSSKIIYHKIAHWGGLGVGADAGLLLFKNKPVSFGINFQNVIKPGVKLARSTDVYPATIRGGISLKLMEGKLNIVADAGATENQDPKYGGGAEFRAFPYLLLRTGVDMTQITFGTGFALNRENWNIVMDYSYGYHYESSGQIPGVHNLSLTLAFGGFQARVRAKPIVFSPQTQSQDNLVRLELRSYAKRRVEKWQLLVKNSLGEVIRTYGTWGEAPKEIQWDGRDDAGLIVPDGNYSYQFLLMQEGGESLVDTGFLTTVKTVGPMGKIIIEEGEKEEKPKSTVEEKKKKKK